MQTQLIDQKHVQLYAVVDSYGVRRAIFTREVDADEYLGIWNQAEKHNLARMTIVTARILEREETDEPQGLLGRVRAFVTGNSTRAFCQNGNGESSFGTKPSGYASTDIPRTQLEPRRDPFTINPVIFGIVALCVVIAVVKAYLIDPQYSLNGQVYTGKGQEKMPIGPMKVVAGSTLEWECESAPTFIELQRVGSNAEGENGSGNTMLGAVRSLKRQGVHTFSDDGTYSVAVDPYMSGKWQFVIRPPK